MKKYIFTFCVLILLLPCMCAGAAVISDCDVQVDERMLTVCGKTDEACKLGIVIRDSSNRIVYMDDVALNEGTMNFEFRMLIESEKSETYTIKVGGNGVETFTGKAEFIVSGENKLLDFSIGADRGVINGSKIKVTVYESSLKNLTASFAASEKSTVWVDGVLQESGVTKNDFDSDVIYIVVAEDGSEREYTVEVTRKKETSSGSGGSGGGSKGSSSVIPFEASIPDETPSNLASEPSKELFTDLDEALWAKEWIYYLYGQGVVNGVTDTTFEPQRSVTREEFVKMLILALGMEPENGESDFEDVHPDAWYCGYINTAAENAIVNGISSTHFGIGNSITREDMAVMLFRAFGSDVFKIGDADTVFNDENLISDYAKEAVTALTKSGIINGKDNGCFEPKQSLTRAEAAKVIGKLMSIK